jgi:hypothetical protein
MNAMARRERTIFYSRCGTERQEGATHRHQAMSLVFILSCTGISNMSISSINNPMSGLTGLLGDFIKGGGQVVQGLNQTKNNVDQQKSINDVFGDPDALDGQQDANKAGEDFDEQLTGLTEAAQEQRRMQQAANGIRQADDTNTNTQVSGLIKSASGINF